MARPIFSARFVTRSEWPAVHADFASIARAKAVSVPKSSCSNASIVIFSCSFSKQCGVDTVRCMHEASPGGFPPLRV